MKKKKFPSQEKYEKENPLIAFRVKRQDYEKIQKMGEKSNTSISELVRKALLKLEIDFSITYKRIYDQGIEKGKTIGHQESFNEGYEKAKQDWGIQLKCWGCKKEIYIKSNSYEHKKIQRIMEAYKLHEICSYG
jgi:flagellar biosynthesis/type III secretory pathway protein FliH